MAPGLINGEAAIHLAWLAWGISWFAASGWSSSAVGRAAEQWRYRLFTIPAFVLTLGFYSHAYRGQFLLLYRASPALQWASFALVCVFIAFGWWGRLTLGRLWSASVQRKSDHQLVETGPYALARHPIYTALIGAALATAIAKGSIIAWAGAACFLIGYSLKAKLEERFLRQELGAEAYDAYATRVPMLIPFLKL